MRSPRSLIGLMPFLFLVLIALTGCSAGSQASISAADTPSLTWQVRLSQAEIKESLTTDQVVTQYNGSKNEVTHVQAPASGNVYVLLNLNIRKTGSQAIVFHWGDLVLIDAGGAEYTRHPNDSFLEQHGYTPRMTGLDLRLGENDGWLVYEIPASSASGELKLIYRAEDGMQELAIQP